MKTIGIGELQNLMTGWNRKSLFRAAHAGAIPGTILPKSTRGGRSNGYRFKMTVEMTKWIGDHQKLTMPDFILACGRRISSEKPFEKDRWETLIGSLRGFAWYVEKKLNTVRTLRGFTNKRKQEVEAALMPLARYLSFPAK